MDDFERYGDYNDIDDEPRGKSPVGLILKIIVGAVIFAVIGILAFRIILFNYYPSGMKSPWVDSVLSEHYVDKGGNVNVLTQSLRAPYDDPDVATFFCDKLFIYPELGRLEITVRYNTAIENSIKTAYGADIDADDFDIFSFRIVRNPETEKGEPCEIGTLTAMETDSKMMYRYIKLVFDGIDFRMEDGENAVKWIRLECEIDGVKLKGESKIFMVAIYENNENFNKFESYKLKKEKFEK